MHQSKDQPLLKAQFQYLSPSLLFKSQPRSCFNCNQPEVSFISWVKETTIPSRGAGAFILSWHPVVGGKRKPKGKPVTAVFILFLFFWGGRSDGQKTTSHPQLWRAKSRTVWGNGAKHRAPLLFCLDPKEPPRKKKREITNHHLELQ